VLRHIVYRFYAHDGRLLYVGMTSKGGARWMDHANVQPWWGDVGIVKVEHFPTRDDAALAEQDAIRDEHPLYNTLKYDGKDPNRHIYRAHRSGSVYQRKFYPNSWVATVRWHGERYYHYTTSRELAERWLALRIEELKQSA
jgi:hypothetical protein